jgi:hypothetical protein
MEMELREGIAKLVSVPKGRRDVLVWDTKTPGFFLRKYSTGRAMWGGALPRWNQAAPCPPL